jgi:hypothetical protein
MNKTAVLLSLLLALSPPIFGQSEEEEFADAPLPPDLPEPLESGEVVEPEVTIIRTEKEVIEEYRLNGRLYMVKVTPVVGKPYYLIDQDGDGRMEGRLSDIYNTPRVPQWVLHTW